MIKRFAVTLLSALVGSVALAAPEAKPTAAEAAQAESATASTQTDVIGSKEAPSVFNIVPWKNKAVAIPKKEISTSILRETLQPLDRDVLRREIQLQQSLSKE